MKLLSQALHHVAEQIQKHGSTKRLNESGTKASLIEPVLAALGWDVKDIDEVEREYKPRKRDNPVDYALFEHRSPRLFVEAKALGQNLNDRKWASQMLGYATVAGVQWVVLTNGREYRIYNAHAPVDVDGKLFRTIYVVTSPDAAADTLSLLSKASLQSNSIEALWRAHFVDRQVRLALDAVFSKGADPAVVRLLRKRTKSLKAADIRASLGRMRMTLDFPLDALDGTAAVARKTRVSGLSSGKKKAKRGRRVATSSVSLSDLIKAGTIAPGTKLMRRYKRQDLEATVLRDGTVRVGSIVYDSPSAAGSAARAAANGPGAKHPATNGWKFWRVSASGRDATTLGMLRAQFEAERQDDGPDVRPKLRAVRE